MVRGRRFPASRLLFQFDLPFRDRYGLIAGVDEAGRGPLAGPVVAAAVILPARCHIPNLADSKRLTPQRRLAVYRRIQGIAVAMGVGMVEPDAIDTMNIYQASLLAMRLALSRLILRPVHVLVDGYPIPKTLLSQTGVIHGDGRSACIAAASVVAKVTRDCLMEAWDRRFPGYGFKRHKGYGTPRHLEALKSLGPCKIHRRSFSPVREASLLVNL